jgi:pimeloyl-ACP methyl ester carboxylesterase
MQLHATAARTFLTPIRTPPRPAERALLDAATRRAIATPRGPVTSYTWGDGDATALLVHGWNGHAGQLGAFVAPLLARGRRVVAFDAPAHGASPGQVAHVPAFADAVEAVVAALGPVSAAVGHSGGAAACALAAARGTPLGAMAWLAPVVSLRAFALAAGHAAGVDGLAGFVAEIEEIAGVPFDALELDAIARALAGPILIVHDRDDALVPIRAVRRAATAIPAATLRETAGLGHGRVLVDPEVVRDAVGFVTM